jgi:glycerol-3-phosphate dehydrogenase
MAADAVDAIAADVSGRIAPTITDRVPLLGADGYHALVNQADQIAARHNLHPYRIRHLLDRYGSQIHAVLALADQRPDLLRPITGAPNYLRVEAVFAVAYEGALHLEDVLTRRTRISIEYPHRGVECAEPVARLVADVLGWDEQRIQREVEHYAARVQAERDAQTQPDDQAADAKRAAAPEIRTRLAEPMD